MLRLRSCCIVARLISPPSASSIPPLHRLLSTTVPVPANPGFAVEEYLVDTCGLTRAQALKASAKLSHLKSPAKPDAVLAFLAGLGLSAADVAALVARDPKFLCAGVETTLSPIVVELTGLGLSPSDIARLLTLAANTHFRNKSVVSKVRYYLRLFGSLEEFLRALKHNHNLLSHNLETVVKRNVGLLQECTLGVCDIGKLCTTLPRMLTANVEQIRAMVASAEGLGVPRGSGMFRQALRSVAFLSEEKIAARTDYLKKTFRWSDAEVGIAVSKGPVVLVSSKDLLKRRSEFLISEVGLEPAYIARHPSLLSYSLEGRLRPRYYVMKFLTENRLLKRHTCYYTFAKATEMEFLDKFICPYKEAAPHLAEDYAAACKGEVPTRFRFT
ncbi:hypothetical protein CFC21_090855 [Triticum aestivum]|uniref:Uncharacterized protein n=2 Tax=Triticum aestivum TaxID=4565 RepID=A0A3B6Q973_WHEAT|nr:transcription termination factor MTERF5, chloroplastic-like [Triticum aestivum]KAF7087692.1 hypothetical protein CFC21_090855 [Triticum aestivum]